MSGLPWYWLSETGRPPPWPARPWPGAARAGRLKSGATVGAVAELVPALPGGAPLSEPLATPVTAAATSRTAIAVPSLCRPSSRTTRRTRSVTASRSLPLARGGHRPAARVAVGRGRQRDLEFAALAQRAAYA